MVVKPLDASGGFGVFHVREGDPNTGADPRAGDQPRPPLDDGAEVPARGAPGRQAHPARRRRAARARCCACPRPTTRAATCTSAPSRWRPSSTTRDTRDRARARPAPARSGPLLRRPRRDRRLAHRDQRHQPDRHPRGERALRRHLRGQGGRASRTEDPLRDVHASLDAPRRRGPRSSRGARRAARRRRPADGSGQASDTQSLVLLAQGDALLASAPAQPGNPPEGASLRLRRVHAGEDLRAGRFRLRAVLEAQSADAFGDHYDLVAGGRISGPLRARDAYLSWAPHRIFTSTRAWSGSVLAHAAGPRSGPAPAGTRRRSRARSRRTSARRRRRRRFRRARLRGGGDVVQPDARRQSLRPRGAGGGPPRGQADRSGRHDALAPCARGIPGRTGSATAWASRSCTARCSRRGPWAPVRIFLRSGAGSPRPPSTSSCTRRRHRVISRASC